MNKLEKGVLFTVLSLISLIVFCVFSFLEIHLDMGTSILYIILFVISAYGSLAVAITNFLSFIYDEIKKITISISDSDSDLEVE